MGELVDFEAEKARLNKELEAVKNKIALDLGLNFATTFAGNWFGSKLVPTNAGWFKPQKFLSVFTKPYGQKILLQILLGGGLSSVVNFVRKFDWSSAD